MINENEIKSRCFFVDEINQAKKDLKSFITKKSYLILFHPLAIIDTARAKKEIYIHNKNSYLKGGTK